MLATDQTKAQQLHWHLLVLLINTATVTEATLNMDKYVVSSNLCTASSSSSSTLLRHYAPTRGPPQPVTVDNVSQQLIANYPADITEQYFYEGTRYNASQCCFCPYSSAPEIIYPEYLMQGGIRLLPTPMYGPCLDGMPSLKMACIQNLILHPPEFVGEYFFPDQQIVLASLRVLSFPFFAHTWIEGTYPSSITNVDVVTGKPISPSLYALGKANALANIKSFQVTNNATGLVNTALTQQLQAPYLTDTATGAEQWTKWEQHFCRQGCHRDSQYQLVKVRPSDYNGGKSPTLAYLRASTGNYLVRCNKCPAFHAAYNWGTINPATGTADYNSPSSPLAWVISRDCYPWFGSVPVIVPYYSASPYYRMNATLVTHSEDTDGVSWPASNGYVQSVACQPNTYNDVCAHTLQYQTALNNPPTPTLGQAVAHQPSCKPCPPGFHTNGASGAWFCLPPAGMTVFIPNPAYPQQSPLRNLLNVYKGGTNMSLAWARRDLLGYEFECGYRPEHCTQCAAANLPSTALPDDFNQNVILKNILMWQQCPSGYYCPAPLDQPIRCPPTFPWSQPSSASVTQCTCARGTFFNASAQTCQPCLQPTSCSAGQYLSGWTQCSQMDGATSGGQCVPCTNLPKMVGSPPLSSATFLPNVPGIEISTLDGQYTGVCPFACPKGYVLGGNAGCLSEYTCTQLGLLKDENSMPVYSASLASLQDVFLVTRTCPLQRVLSNAISSAKTSLASTPQAPTQWLPVATACGQVNASCASPAACMVTVNATFANNFQCMACPPLPQGAFYNLPQSTTTDPKDMSGMQASYACNPACAGGYYYNASASPPNCSSCTALEIAICPTGFHIKGQGCYGVATPFPTLNPVELAKTNCILCGLSLPAPGSNQWLDISDPVKGCAIKACTATDTISLGVTSYIATPCGGTSDRIVMPCTFTCLSSSYFLQGSCSTTSTAVCKLCTAFMPGSYIQTNCTPITDAVWKLCSTPGTYCPGDGSQLQCPNNQTSQPGASTQSDCFCPAGTAFSQQLPGFCVPFLCPDAVPSDASPGAGYISAYYMVLASDTLQTACLPCPQGSVSLTSVADGIGINSCVCKPAAVAGSGTSSSSGYNSYYLSGANCTLCPSSANLAALSSTYCTTGGMGYYSKIPDTCWRGSSYFSNNNNCVCVAPPFTKISPGSTTLADCSPNPQMCQLGFNLADPSGGAPPAESNLTGSSLYVPRPSSLSTAVSLFWSAASYAAAASTTGIDYSPRRLVATSDWKGWGNPDNWQFILWLLKDPTILTIFAAPAPSNTLQGYNPYAFSSTSWTITPGPAAGSSAFIAEIAVAQWQTAQTPALLHGGSTTTGGGGTTEVAAVLCSGSSPPALYINTLQVSLLGNQQAGYPQWSGPAQSSLGFAAGNASTISTVALGHAYLNGASTFLVALNDQTATPTTNNVVVVAVYTAATSKQAIQLKISNGYALDAAAFMASPTALADGTVWLYLCYGGGHGSTQTIKLRKWNPLLQTASAETDELFFAKPAAYRMQNLFIAWPDLGDLTPTFLALVQSSAGDSSASASPQQRILHPNGPPYKIMVADITQRTFTEIQGMPSDTVNPSVLTAIPMGVGSLMLIAGSTGANFFNIKLPMCMPSQDAATSNIPRYWDGTQCRPHVCVRSRPCATNAGQQWDIYSMSCKCVQGYYVSSPANSADLQCTICPADFYCPAGTTTKQSCPVGMTSLTGATNLSQCTCHDSSYFNSDAGVCQSCPAGSWCPNRWSVIPCAGAVDQSRSVPASQYPKGCVCLPGYQGVGCNPCPAGPYYYCPADINSVTNAVTMASLVWLHQPQDPATTVCSAITPIVTAYLQTSNIWYLKRQDTLVPLRLQCTYVPAPTPMINPMVSIMVQIEQADSSNSVIKSLPQLFFLNSTLDMATLMGFQIDLSNVFPLSHISSPGSTYNNTPVLCPTGKISTADRTACMCDAGYETSQLQCSPCAINYYKDKTGSGNCNACPIGSTTTTTGSVACNGRHSVNLNSSSPSASDASSSPAAGINTGLIVGLSVGGSVVFALLVWASLSYASTGTPATATATKPP